MRGGTEPNKDILRRLSNHPRRTHQNDNFVVEGFDGEQIEELLGVVMAHEPDNYPIIINIKATNNTWQRYFLDAWIGFWEDCEYLKEDDEDRLVDYGELFGLKGKTIKSIKCINSKIVIELEDGCQFVLQLISSKKDDTQSEVKFT